MQSTNMISTEQTILNKAFTKFFKEREISGYDGIIDLDVYNSIDEKVEEAIIKLENNELGKKMDKEAKKYIVKKYQDVKEAPEITPRPRDRNRFLRYIYPKSE